MTDKPPIGERFEVIIQILLLLVAVIAIVYSVNTASVANNIAQTSLNVSDFSTQLIPYVVEADVGNFYYNGSTILSAYGFVNLSIVVVTPHALIVNCSDFMNQLTLHYKLTSPLYQDGTPIPLYDPQRYTSNSVYAGVSGENPDNWSNEPIFPSAVHAPYNQQYLAFVQGGVSQVNFSIPIHVNFYLNQAVFDKLLEGGKYTGCRIQLTDFTINVHYYDVQTKKDSLQPFSGTIDTYLWVDTPAGMFG